MRALSFAGHVAAILAGQSREIANEQGEQQHATGNVDRKNQVLQAVEVFRLLHRLRQQEQGSQRQAHARKEDGGTQDGRPARLAGRAHRARTRGTRGHVFDRALAVMVS